MQTFFNILSVLIKAMGALLPFSAEGHLTVLERLTGRSLTANDPFFGVGLEICCLLAVVLLYHRTLWRMLKGLFALAGGLFAGTFRWRRVTREQAMAVYLLLAAIPIVIIEVVQAKFDLLGSVGSSFAFIGAMMLITAALIFIGTHSLCKNYDLPEMKVGHALKLGLFRGAGILGGLSGITTALTMAVNMGFKKKAALDFAVLLSIPALLTSILLDAPAIALPLSFAPDQLFLLLGLAAAIGALLLFKWIVKKDWIEIFMFYNALAGIAVIVLNFVL